MKKSSVLLMLLLLLCSRSYTQPVITGNDRDSHGCIPSAGYTWSQLKKECIRVFDLDLKLKEVKPKKNATFNAYLIISANQKQAEIFVPNMPQSILLTAIKTKGVPTWKNGIWQLEKKSKYVIKKGKLDIYIQY